VAERYASGGSDGVVRVWSTKDGKLLHEFGLPDHIHGTARFTNFINRVTFSPNGLLLAAGIQSYSQISVFSLRDNKMLFSKHAQALSQGSTGREDPGKLRFMAFSPDNKMLISSDYSERYMRLWNTISGELVGVLQGHPGHTAEFSISPDGKTVASTGLDGSLKLWHLATRRELATLPIAGTIGPLQFSPDGTFLMAAQQDHLQFFRIKQP
jgi:WD40 repeat protein